MQQLVEGPPAAIIEFIYKNLRQLNTGYKLENIRKCHPLF